MYRLGNQILECSPVERDMGVLAVDYSNESQQCALAAKRASNILGYIKCGIANWPKEVIVPVYSPLVQPHLEYRVQFWAPQNKKNIRMCPKEGNKYSERTREQLRMLGLFSLVKSRLRHYLVIHVFVMKESRE